MRSVIREVTIVTLNTIWALTTIFSVVITHIHCFNVPMVQWFNVLKLIKITKDLIVLKMKFEQKEWNLLVKKLKIKIKLKQCPYKFNVHL